MAPKKLSDVDRQEILKRYRQPEENTVTIANSYGVSTSTISRILKQNLSESEYESLIQQKRSGTQKPLVEQGDLPGIAVQIEPPLSLMTSALGTEEADLPPSSSLRSDTKPVISPPRRRQRQRLESELSSPEEFSPHPQPAQLELPPIPPGPSYPLNDERSMGALTGSVPVIAKTELEEIEAELGKASLAPVAELDEDLDEDLEDEDLEDEDLDDDLDLDDELEDDDDLEGDEDLDDEEGLSHRTRVSTVQVQKGSLLQVLPWSDAAIPKTCYIVVDRSSELITRPLKDFADLGQIPAEETQEKTLPIFDNHRVAKRFTRRMQRVVKVPDGRVLQKVRPYLQSKGITRLLIDGQVYSL